MLWVRSLIVVLCFAALPVVAQEHERPPPGAHSAAPGAADSHASKAGEASGEEHAHGPKYELLTIDGLTALWTIIVFVILLVVVRAAAWNPIQKVLTEREKFITDSLQQAKKDRAEAEVRLREYGEKLETARGEATAIVAEARRDAEVVKRKIEDDGKEEAAATLQRAKREIAVATDTAVKQLYTLSADLATSVASRIIRKELDAKEHERLIAESIEELEAAGGNGRDRT